MDACRLKISHVFHTKLLLAAQYQNINYKTLSKAISEMAKDYLPGTFKDVVTTPLAHDSKQVTFYNREVRHSFTWNTFYFTFRPIFNDTVFRT
jgi:hypothetical protein